MCLDGFADPGFQRLLATRNPAHAPEGVIGFASDFDELGQTYTPFAGTDANAAQRNHFRRFLHQFLSGEQHQATDADHAFANQFFTDKDWMAQRQHFDTIGY